MDSKRLEQDLRSYRPAGVSLPDEFIWPRYDGLSVGNIAPAAAQILGATLPDALPPLRADLLEGLTDGVKRVVVLVMDAMGWLQIQRVMARHPGLIFERLGDKGRLMPLTTTFLSTTNSVLNTIWSAHPPVQHGLLAYELFLREWMMAVEAITMSPVHRPFEAMLTHWGLEPETFLPVPSVAQMLSVQGILTYSVTYKHFIGSTLSVMQFRGARDVRGYVTASDFWVTLRQLLRDHSGERCLIGGYWSAVDTLGHSHGPEDETGEAEILSIATLMERIFLDALEPAEREGTLLLVTADHGQITTPASSAVRLDQHPDLRDMLFMAPLGESRVPIFYVRNGRYDDTWAYLNEHFSDRFIFFDSGELVRSGLLGPGTPYAEVFPRLGEIVGIAREDAYVARSLKDVERLRGRHGGLSPQEMLVPLLALRLDA